MSKESMRGDTQPGEKFPWPGALGGFSAWMVFCMQTVRFGGPSVDQMTIGLGLLLVCGFLAFLAVVIGEKAGRTFNEFLLKRSSSHSGRSEFYMFIVGFVVSYIPLFGLFMWMYIGSRIAYTNSH